MEDLLRSIRACSACVDSLEFGPRPVVSAAASSKIVIVGQAPGLAVHESGIPWDDKSGDNLRTWLGVDNSRFYDTNNFAIIPMGFCYPGRGKSGDLPPMKICAPMWHQNIFNEFNEVELIVLIGKYAQNYYLPKSDKKNLTQRVRDFEQYLPEFFVLPHPSPRNNIWQAKNQWFKSIVLPHLKKTVSSILQD